MEGETKDSDPSGPDAQIDHAASLSYWSSISPDVNGMLGGFPQISRIDLRGSATFLEKLRRQSSLDAPQANNTKLLARAVDCGAGIGRVTKGLLANVCEVVDIVEPVEIFVHELSHGEPMAAVRDQGKIGDVFQTSLEKWEPGVDKYDLLWNQWCLGHLTDAQLVRYLKSCGRALKPGGWIVVKENVNTDEEGKDLFDPVDNSVTRGDDKFRSLFDNARLRLVKTELQRGFPRELGLHPVRLYALKSSISSQGEE